MLIQMRIAVRLAELKKGFTLLPDEDQKFLRVWFRIPPDSNCTQTCRLLAQRAPSRILEDITALVPVES